MNNLNDHPDEQIIPIELIISPQRDLYPYCIVWTIIPCLTWLLPWVGHTGICDDKGTIYDFLGYCINVGNMGFGSPKKYVRLQIPDTQIQLYRNSINQANQLFRRKAHDFCCNNCHHHVAHVLNLFGYQGRRNWTQFSVYWLCLSGQYISFPAMVLSFPFLFVIIVIVVVINVVIQSQS